MSQALASPLISLAGVTKRFGAHSALDGVSLKIARGEVVCLLGPSGCGKSTLLRLIAGFETPDAGTIHLDGEDLTHRPPHRRPVNMMFQSYALFPHMSVARNIAYGLHGLGMRRAAIGERVRELSRLVRLEGLGERRPHQLSGGQRQRVALARALAREPKLLLLDEPLGALDRGLREETQAELRALQRRLGTSFIVVTHDPDEAMALADRICVMAAGRLVQHGSARELYEHPADAYVAGALGEVNLIPGRLGPKDVAGFRMAETGLGSIGGTVSEALREASHDTGIQVAIRPEHIAFASSGSDPDGSFVATIDDVAFLGDRIRFQARMSDGSRLRGSQPAAMSDVVPGAQVRVSIKPGTARLLPT